MRKLDENSWLDASQVKRVLQIQDHGDSAQARDVLAKARLLKGLSLEDVGVLVSAGDPHLVEEMFATARAVKEEIYGHRIVFFAPLYISNICGNECTYCAFRKSNSGLVRHALTQEEIARETEILINQGHKRLLVVAGESNPGGLNYILDTIATIYSVKNGNGEIRRVNINIAPQDTDTFRAIKAAGIGTYQCFQETYDREVYARVHLRGRKSDFDWRLSVMDRAMEAGIDDVGVGVLFGLGDWRFEILSLIQHIAHLEDAFGVGCHTISVPRLEPAHGSELASSPPNPVSDDDFKKIVAILRMAVPYTGLIMTTRETPQMRAVTLALGVSQISAGSRTNPGGYAASEQYDASQFQLGDHRTLEEVVSDLAAMKYMPSFCTACYRVGRTGKDFMDLAKPGLIKKKCAPNSVGTFLEYLTDYASHDTQMIGERIIREEMSQMGAKEADVSQRIMRAIRKGKRDVFC
ncbi:MAG: [FeFe] hydrogenase H-cluster radical SAM maturase HydG [Alphaproteobacteria bacterium]|nr:[FeFe] hydrogenase H-cluster radical SAM maturase HydG [Alphaproteobacteria bacterium]